MKRKRRKASKLSIASSLATDVGAIAGAAGVGYGLALIYTPLAFIWAGGVLLALCIWVASTRM